MSESSVTVIARAGDGRLTLRLSLAFLAFIALACIVGPSLSPHDYDHVYRDYVLVPPSFTAHPTSTEAEAALAALAQRMRLNAQASSFDAARTSVTLTSDKPIDLRSLRLFERSDVFAPAQVVGTQDEGRVLQIEVALRHQTFLFGTDSNGRDLLTRLLIAGRISLAVGLLASLVALVIGVAWGAVAGYAGGRVDQLMMRVVEIIYALPFVFFVIVLVVLFGRNFILIFVAIGTVEWLDMARIVRGETLSIKHRDYVAAAEALGVSPAAILKRHVVPNMLGPISAYATLIVAQVILLESFVSFLGLGVQEPLTSWGLLIADGTRMMQSSVYLLVFPAAALGMTLAALNGVGTHFREAFDPPSR